jgi:protein SCO1/2
VLLGILTYNYSSIFIKIDLDGFYGKHINQEAYNFNLKSSDGEEVHLSDFQGRFVLLTFGFTKCTGVCPLNLYRFKKLSEGLHEKSMTDLNLDFIFISFDEIRDTPKEMEAFLENFTFPGLYGLLSGKDRGIQVARNYNNHINIEDGKRDTGPEYQINHNGFLYLIDPRGRLSLIYMQQEVDEDKLINDIKKLKVEFGS